MIETNTPRANILLVDDKDDGLLALETVLRDCNYNLVKARSGKEALTHLLSMEFAVILLDVHMPDMDGFETASYIKRRERTRSTPIIFVTGVDQDQRFISHGYESGAVDYLFKPFDPQILRSKVSVFVELYEQAQQIKTQAKQIAEIQAQEQSRRLQQLEMESRIRYRNLADAIPHIVWKATADYSVEHFNQTWTDYTGFTLEQSCGSGWTAAFMREDLVRLLKTWREASSAGKNFEMECRIYNQRVKDHRWHLIKAVAERDHETGKILTWLLTCTDIQKLKDIEQELIGAKKDAEAANKAKSFFLANMSHEIRTPLGAIMGFSDLLVVDDFSSEDRQSYAAIIKKNGEQLLQIIDEILDISKIESGSLSLANERIYLKELVQTVSSCLSLQVSKKRLNLTFRVDGQVPEYMYSDPTRVRQILINIIGNAVKFTHKGSIDVTIKFENSQNPYIEFIIQDTGHGIEEQHITGLFRPFSQGDSSTSRKFGGTGLGLALSRKLAQALGGDVLLLETVKDKGSIFSVRIGTKHSITPMISTLSEVLTKVQREDEQNRLMSSGLEGVTVLLVDDAPENRWMISMFLQKAGALVDVAQDGQEAIEKALQGSHDLVLMDIQMPGMDGYQATQHLREQGYKKPILAVTAHALVEEREKCIEIGCTDHLSKPVNQKDLVERVARYSRTPVL